MLKKKLININLNKNLYNLSNNLQVSSDIISTHNKINVTKPFLPPKEEFFSIIDRIWDNHILSNNGPIHDEFVEFLKKHEQNDNVSIVSNGTMGLILAINSLGLKGEIITSPFSFIASSNAIALSGLKPVFCDVDNHTFNIDPDKIEKLITPKTSAILAIHCFGCPCDVEKLELIAKKYSIKIIYDAAHSFGVKLNGKSILNYGDISVTSFHATKVFHTAEGGMIVTKLKKHKNNIDELSNFGFDKDNTNRKKIKINSIGYNSKLSELNCAMGLAQTPYIKKIIKSRSIIYELYKSQLKNIKGLRFQLFPKEVTNNYSYCPIIIENDFPINRDELYNFLELHNVSCKKYFWPVISELYSAIKFKKFKIVDCKNSLELSKKILCLPIYPNLPLDGIKRICNIIKSVNDVPDNSRTPDYTHLKYPLIVDRRDYWKQVKRTVNGNEVADKDINTIINNVRKNLDLNKSDSLLDLGCGNGKLASYFFKNINKYHGIDFSDYLLKIAKEDFYLKNKTTFQKLNLRHNYNQIKNAKIYNKVLCYGAFSYFGKKSGKSIIEVLGSKENITSMYLGNIPNIKYSKEFFSNRNIVFYDLNDETSPIGVWWDFEELELYLRNEGFYTKKVTMPSDFYASKYRFDIYAFR